MRWTVGPLPPAVYWRRRAVVLSGLILVILLIASSCGGSGASNANQPPALGVGDQRSSPATATQPALSHSPAPTPTTATGTPTPPPSATGSPPASTSATCADAEIKVTVSIESTSATDPALHYGGTFGVTMRISNVSNRDCTRDVGSVPEEITVKQGSKTVWTSGKCGQAVGPDHDVRTFHPGDLITSHANWNSYKLLPDECVNSATAAARGRYQVTGHVGTDASATVTFTIS